MRQATNQELELYSELEAGDLGEMVEDAKRDEAKQLNKEGREAQIGYLIEAGVLPRTDVKRWFE